MFSVDRTRGVLDSSPLQKHLLPQITPGTGLLPGRPRVQVPLLRPARSERLKLASPPPSRNQLESIKHTGLV